MVNDDYFNDLDKYVNYKVSYVVVHDRIALKELH